MIERYMMQQSNLQFLLQLQRDSELVRNKANELANQLIIDFDINEGFQIAQFLKLSHGLDNYSAVRVWTDRWLRRYCLLSDGFIVAKALMQDDSLYGQLKSEFFGHFPEVLIA